MHIHLVFVYHHILGISLLYIVLKFGVCSLLLSSSPTCQRVAATRYEENGKSSYDDAINPIHIEFRHLWLIAVVFVSVRIVNIHIFSYL